MHYIIGLAGMPLSYCHTCRVGTACVHLGEESPMPEYSAGWLETKRGINVICKHMHTLSLKTVRCEVVFTHLVCPTPRVVADMDRQVGILQVRQPLCTQFLTFFRLCRIRELKKKLLWLPSSLWHFPCSLKQPKALHCGILILVRTRAGTTCVADDL